MSSDEVVSSRQRSIASNHRTRVQFFERIALANESNHPGLLRLRAERMNAPTQRVPWPNQLKCGVPKVPSLETVKAGLGPDTARSLVSAKQPLHCLDLAGRGNSGSVQTISAGCRKRGQPLQRDL